MQPAAPVAAGLYVLLGVACLTTLTITFRRHPLFPFRPSELAWCRAWLATTVADYYGAALPLCGVIVATSPTLAEGLTWSMGVLVLGSPVACAWAARRLLMLGTLA